MNYIKTSIFIFLLLFMTNIGFGSTDFYVFGKGSFVGKTGSEDQYKEGENDFPIASPFTIGGLGMGLKTDIYPLFFGIEFHYNLRGKTTLTDPSDNDTVNINTYNYASGFIMFGTNLIKKKRLTLFINTGIGLSYALNTEMKTYVSDYGYETQIEPPEKKYPLTAFAGLGMKIHFNSFLGFLLNTRYQYMDQNPAQSALCVLGGFVYSF